jgi:hypothetical protein
MSTQNRRPIFIVKGDLIADAVIAAYERRRRWFRHMGLFNPATSSLGTTAKGVVAFDGSQRLQSNARVRITGTHHITQK